MPLTADITEINDALVAKLQTEAGPLGLRFVGDYDAKRIPRYPAVIVAPGPKSKQVAGIPKFDIEFNVDLYVYHADMTLTHSTRSREDILLVNNVEAVLESDRQLGGLVIFGFVSGVFPGLIQSRSSKTELVVGTRMEWVGISRQIMT